MKRSCLVFALILVPGFAFAQDGFFKDFTAEEFEKVVKNDLSKEFDKEEVPGGYKYDIKGTPFFATYHQQKKFILFFASAKLENFKLQQLNDWNRDAVYSRVYAVDKLVVFEVPLGIAAGTSRDTVKSYYENTVKEFKDFRKVLQGTGD